MSSNPSHSKHERTRRPWAALAAIVTIATALVVVDGAAAGGLHTTRSTVAPVNCKGDIPLTASGQDPWYTKSARPTRCDTAPAANCWEDQYGYCMRNCTSYVAQWLVQHGVKVSVTGLGNGWDWWKNAQAVAPEGSIPVEGAVAVSPPTGTNPYGHVTVVTHVYPDSSYDTQSYDGFTETYYPEAKTTRYTNFIYFPGVVAPPQQPTTTTPRTQPAGPLAGVPDGSIVRRADGASWVLLGGRRQPIRDLATDVCAQVVDRRPVAKTGLSAADVATVPESAPYACSLDRVLLRALDKPDPKPSYAFHDGKRFWVSDSWTYNALARQGYRKVDVPSEATIKSLPDGGTEAARLDPADVPANSIVSGSAPLSTGSLQLGTSSWYVDQSRARHPIASAADAVCLRDLRGVPSGATGLTAGQVAAIPLARDTTTCTIDGVVVQSSDGSSYLVRGNAKAWIPDGSTYAVLAKTYRVVGPWPAADVNLLPNAPRMPYAIDPAGVRNSLICRSDNVCWAVDGAGVRHFVPSYGDFVCWRFKNGWGVSRTGLNAEQTSTGLPEAGAWGCSMNGSLLATNEGAWYYMQGNTLRWVTDGESLACYLDRGLPVIRGASMSDARPLGETSWMPRCLSPNRVKSRIVREGGGTAYFVDRGGLWHWIPNGSVWNCLTRRYPVLISSATWEQINSLRREASWANCSM